MHDVCQFFKWLGCCLFQAVDCAIFCFVVHLLFCFFKHCSLKFCEVALMIATLTRPLFLCLAVVGFCIGLLVGQHPPDLSTATTLGRISGFVGYLIMAAAFPTMVLYARYRNVVRKGFFHKSFWHVVYFSTAATVCWAILYLIGPGIVPLGVTLAIAVVAVCCLLCMAHALKTYDRISHDGD